MMLVTLTWLPPSWVAMLPQKFSAATTWMVVPLPPVPAAAAASAELPEPPEVEHAAVVAARAAASSRPPAARRDIGVLMDGVRTDRVLTDGVLTDGVLASALVAAAAVRTAGSWVGRGAGPRGRRGPAGDTTRKYVEMVFTTSSGWLLMKTIANS